MFSILRKGLLYKNVSPDIVEHDIDIDADQWSYNDKDVYRGSLDPEYLKESLNVYWLYDDDSKRVGLAEHESEHPEEFKALWFYDNPFATLFQDPSWKSNEKTLWSLLSNEAYQDCLETDFKHVHDLALNSGTLLMTPERLINKPDLFVCSNCSKKSFMKSNICSTAESLDLDFSQYSILFLDEDFVIYEKPKILPQQLPDASDQEQEQEPEQAHQLESQKALPDSHQVQEQAET